jgi:hypothetical protein
VTGNQRHTEGRQTFRPAGEVIRTADYEVEAVTKRAAKAFVLLHHYSGTFPAARFCFGLFYRGLLVGVAVFSHPCSDAVLTSVFPGSARRSVELGRFVLIDAVPGNGETWFLARCFELLRELRDAAGEQVLVGVVSFSDPHPRTSAERVGGVWRTTRTIFPGHVGTIYQAHNAVYVGKGTARTLRVLPDGRVMNARAASKIRAGDQGWQYAARMFEAHGAPPCPSDDFGRRLWLREQTGALTRPLPHAGNYKYAWALRRAARRHLTAGLSYPKLLAA